jgi:hypothetical protein
MYVKVTEYGYFNRIQLAQQMIYTLLNVQKNPYFYYTVAITVSAVCKRCLYPRFKFVTTMLMWLSVLRDMTPFGSAIMNLLCGRGYCFHLHCSSR